MRASDSKFLKVYYTIACLWSLSGLYSAGYYFTTGSNGPFTMGFAFGTIAILLLSFVALIAFKRTRFSWKFSILPVFYVLVFISQIWFVSEYTTDISTAFRTANILTAATSLIEISLVVYVFLLLKKEGWRLDPFVMVRRGALLVGIVFVVWLSMTILDPFISTSVIDISLLTIVTCIPFLAVLLLMKRKVAGLYVAWLLTLICLTPLVQEFPDFDVSLLIPLAYAAYMAYWLGLASMERSSLASSATRKRMEATGISRVKPRAVLVITISLLFIIGVSVYTYVGPSATDLLYIEFENDVSYNELTETFKDFNLVSSELFQPTIIFGRSLYQQGESFDVFTSFATVSGEYAFESCEIDQREIYFQCNLHGDMDKKEKERVVRRLLDDNPTMGVLENKTFLNIVVKAPWGEGKTYKERIESYDGVKRVSYREPLPLPM